MKRFILLLVLSAAAVVAGLPWWVGARAEEQHQSYREGIGADAPFEIVSQEYRRGWLRSQAKTVLGPRGQGGAGNGSLPPLYLVVKDEIEHGPIHWSSLLRGELPQELVLARTHSEIRVGSDDSGDADPEAQPPILELDTTVGFDGRATGRVHSRAAERALGEDLLLSWDGTEGQWHYDPETTRVVGTFVAPAFEMESEKGELSVRGLELDFDYRDDPDGIPLGDTRLAVAELSSMPASEGGPPKFRADGLELIYFLQVEGPDANAAMAASWEGFTSKGEAQQGGYAQIALNGLDSPTLARMLEAVEAMSQAEGEEPDTAPVLMMFPALLERAELQVDFELADHAALQATASLQGGAPGGSPLAALAQLAVDLELSAATGFAEERLAAILAARAETPGARLEANPRARELLRELEDRALIVSDGRRYATQVRYRQLQLEVNGQPIDPKSLSDLGGQPAAAQAVPGHMPLPGPVTSWPAAPAP